MASNTITYDNCIRVSFWPQVTQYDLYTVDLLILGCAAFFMIVSVLMLVKAMRVLEAVRKAQTPVEEPVLW